MTVKEALAEILDVLDVDEHEEAIATVTNAITEDGTAENYKEKYDKLYEKYKNRFLDMLDSDRDSEDVVIKNEDEERVTFENLEFDGETE